MGLRLVPNYLCRSASSVICLVWLWLVLPEEHPVDRGGKIDYIGAFLGLSSLLLFNFTWKSVHLPDPLSLLQNVNLLTL